MNGQLWKRESLFAKAKNLPEDIIVYSAWDVEPLLDIYSIMTSIIEPDFVPLLNVSHFLLNQLIKPTPWLLILLQIGLI